MSRTSLHVLFLSAMGALGLVAGVIVHAPAINLLVGWAIWEHWKQHADWRAHSGEPQAREGETE